MLGVRPLASNKTFCLLACLLQPGIRQVPNGNTAVDSRDSSEAPVKVRPPPRPLPYASKPRRPLRSQEDSSITEFKETSLSPIAKDQKMKMYASSPDLLGRGSASEAPGRQLRTSTPEKRRRAAPPPPKPPHLFPQTKLTGDQPPSQTPKAPPSSSVVSTTHGSPGAERKVKPSIKKRPAPPRPSRPPPVAKRSSTSKPNEPDEQGRKRNELKIDLSEASSDAVRHNNRRDPPMFIPPPPPDDLPPPIDQCETPVDPLTEEEIRDACSPTSRE